MNNKIEVMIEFIKKYWILTFVFIVFFSISLTYVIVITPFPPAMGIDRNTWVGFLGSILGGIISGVLSVGGVFLTLNYYREKDTEQRYEENNRMILERAAEHERRIQEIQLSENARNLRVKPYLRLMSRLRKDTYKYAQIRVEVSFNNIVHSNSDTIYIELSNNGMGAALNVECMIKGEQQVIAQGNGVSMDKSEDYLIILEIYNFIREKEEKVDFIFTFNDILDNKYEQEINTTLTLMYADKIKIDNIQQPKLIVQANIKK